MSIELPIKPGTVWKVRISTERALRMSTLITLLGFFCYVVYGFIVVGDRSFVTVSDILAYSRGTAITFSLLVLLHGYTLYIYLVVISGVLGPDTLRMRFTFTVVLVYWISLLVITYLPVTHDDDFHGAFAFTILVSGLLSMLTQEHAMCILDDPQKQLVFTEVFSILFILGAALLFWYGEVIVAEYIVFCVFIVEKYLKLQLLCAAGLIELGDSATLSVIYIAPKPKHRVISPGTECLFLFRPTQDVAAPVY